MNLRSEGMRRVMLFITCLFGLVVGIYFISVAIEAYKIGFSEKLVLVIFWAILTSIPFFIWKALCWVQDGFKQNT